LLEEPFGRSPPAGGERLVSGAALDAALLERRLVARRQAYAARSPADLLADASFLVQAGLSPRLVDLARRLAAHRGTSLRDELFALDGFDRSLYWRSLARHVGVSAVDDPARVRLHPQLRYLPTEAVRRASRALALADGATILLVAPEPDEIEPLRQLCHRHQQLAARVRIAAPETIRAIILAGRERVFGHCAVHRLARALPALSAASRLSTISRFAIGVLLAMVAILALLYPVATWAVLGAGLSAIFLNTVAWKLAAALWPAKREAHAQPAERDLPTYSVLVPLYREANMVRELVAAMSALDYPRSKLQVLLIVEADDGETRAALERFAGMRPFETVVVPTMGPRTKPKALAFAVPFARGDMVVVYDAEDRPEPDQLRKAAAAFAADPALGCVQARLTADNRDSWLARMFTIEYGANFDVLLPALARWGVPLPLGGTSNHLPRAVLKRIGAWDPFNVTEDADLGVRLARFGYRTRTLASRTYEEAPLRWREWLPQRRRWLKGWLQTALVALRRGGRRRLRPIDALAVHGLISGAVLSLLVYPL
jgi:glycosyltransferase XagB